MVKNIHFIVIGKQESRCHLAGIPRLKASEVVLFCCKDNIKKAKQIAKNLMETGVEYRIVLIKNEYLDAYKKASEEAAASFTDDSCIILNMSTGPPIVLLAIEDAVRIQLYFFDKRTHGTAICSALRFIVRGKRKLKFEVAPIWNFYRDDYNHIFEVLAETPEPISLKKIYQIISDFKPDIGGYEAFRKTFREFKRLFQNVPCFKEVVEKSPKYKIYL